MQLECYSMKSWFPFLSSLRERCLELKKGEIFDTFLCNIFHAERRESTNSCSNRHGIYPTSIFVYHKQHSIAHFHVFIVRSQILCVFLHKEKKLLLMCYIVLVGDLTEFDKNNCERCYSRYWSM